MKFCSVDFFKKVQDVGNSDQEFLKTASGFNATFTFRVVDKVAELPPVFMKFADGKITDTHTLSAGEKTDFTLEGGYNTWMMVSKGELDGATAVMTRQMKLIGSMGAIIKFGKAFRRLLEIMAQVPVEY